MSMWGWISIVGCLAQVDMTQAIMPVQWKFLTFGQVDGPVAVSDNVSTADSEDGMSALVWKTDRRSGRCWTDSAFSTGSKIVSGVVTDSQKLLFLHHCWQPLLPR